MLSVAYGNEVGIDTNNLSSLSGGTSKFDIFHQDLPCLAILHIERRRFLRVGSIVWASNFRFSAVAKPFWRKNSGWGPSCSDWFSLSNDGHSRIAGVGRVPYHTS